MENKEKEEENGVEIIDVDGDLPELFRKFLILMAMKEKPHHIAMPNVLLKFSPMGGCKVVKITARSS